MADYVIFLVSTDIRNKTLLWLIWYVKKSVRMEEAAKKQIGVEGKIGRVF